MAKSNAVWGIDIGQCSLKALRCRPHEKSDRIVADAFDYIEYPQMLGEPGADADELVGDALTLFLSRNTVRDDTVVISVPGQAGLARFIKLPPVEAEKIPDIVRYEARQQIPFDLKDVIWDYQRMGGGSVHEGFALEAEIGLFAMKRDQVYRALEPFDRAGVAVQVVQLAPLALYNFLLFDQLTALPSAEDYDPENPPESTLILSVGAEGTDLVISDGFRVWQRSVPLGGSHFTKALTKELRLTFAAAEHLKRNATANKDPKAVFRAMGPVFNECATEIQRSLSYYASIERKANVTRAVALGNAMKLPGLRKFLQEKLEIPVARVESYRGLVGSSVVSTPAFQENLGSFGVCYGLCLQGLGRGEVHTNLLPPEIVTQRLIRQKKPWAVAAAAILLLGLAISFGSYARALGTVDTKRFADAESKATAVASTAQDLKTKYEEAGKAFEETDRVGQNLVGNVEGRLLWLELMKAVSECLPKDPKPAETEQPQPPKEVDSRSELHITSLECQYVPNLSQWFSGVQRWYEPLPGEKIPEAPLPAAAPAEPAREPSESADSAENAENPAPPGDKAPKWGPQGPGWVLRFKGVHYHNSDRPGEDNGAQFVRKTLIARLQSKKTKVELPRADGSGEKEWVTVKQLGLNYPVLISPGRIREATVENPYADVVGNKPAARGNSGDEPAAAPAAKRAISVREFPFTVEVAWQPTPASKRQQIKQQQEREKKEAP